MNCPVCFESIKKSETLTCGHNVHETCVLPTKKPYTCPVCRSNVKLKTKRAPLSVELLKQLIPKLPEKILNRVPELKNPIKDDRWFQLYKSMYLVIPSCSCTPILHLDGMSVTFNMVQYMKEGEDELLEQFKLALYYFKVKMMLREKNMITRIEICDECHAAAHIQQVMNLMGALNVI